MASFLIYVFESGICLTIFYLGYLLFFRKETFFTFNRLYLLGSMIIAISLPALHWQIELGSNSYLLKTAKEVNKVKSYYERVILLTDPNYDPVWLKNEQENSGFLKQFINKQSVLVKAIELGKSINYPMLFYRFYLWGVVFFILRFVLLLFSLIGLIKQSEVEEKDHIKLVKISEELPSFSFFNWVFINVNLLSKDEFDKVWAHEIVHVKQKHSIDILLAQCLIIFQWFNPLLWRVKKSLKTCHEYIADEQVVTQGFGLFDYQSLILGQLISIRSVDLVNNFNLLSIKKRIAMLNKNKSKQSAKLKVFVILPLLVASFVFFADMKFPELSTKVMGNNKANVKKVGLPYAYQVKKIDKNEISLRLIVGNDEISDGDKTYAYTDIAKIVSKKKSNDDASNKKVILLEIDENEPMKFVDVIKQELRENSLFRIAYKVNTSNSNANEIYALVNLLPPMDAILLEESELMKNGTALFKMDKLNNNSPSEMAVNLAKFIRENPKYVMVYSYDNSTSYSEYIEHIDIIYKTIYDLRDEYVANTGKKWFELDESEQKEVKMKYPLTLTLNNTDRD
jgi:hypothetical protein